MKKRICKILSSILALTLAFTSIGVLGTTRASAANIVLEDGCYYLYSINMEYGLNDQFNAGDGGRMVIDKIDGEPNEIHIITNTGLNGYVTIQPYSQKGCYLSGENGYDKQLVIRKAIPSEAVYQWLPIKVDGGYVFKNRANGYVIDCAHGQNTTTGNPYLLYSRNGYAEAQTLIPVRISESKSSYTTGTRVTNFTPGYYKICAYNNSSMAINCQYGAKSGAYLVLDPYNKEGNEIVYIANEGNGKFTLRPAADTSLCIAPSNSYVDTQLSVKSYNGTEDCFWEIYKSGSTYLFRNCKTGLYMDDYCCQTATGTKVISYSNNGCSAQKWYVTKVDYAAWQMPMKNAYCTWSSYSNMSWGSYTYTGTGRNYHLGLDIYGTGGTVYAAANGTVVACSSSASGANGRYVIIQHTINGKTVYSFYAHLASVAVTKGQPVTTSTQIGVAGGSGYGSNSYYGTHLHFAIVDTLWSNGKYYGYSTKFTGNKTTYSGVTFYNPVYVINNNKLP